MGFWFLYLMASVLLMNTKVMSSPFLAKRSAPAKGPIIDDKAVNSRLARQWFTLDPDAQEVLSEVDGCETSTGEFGICQSPIICALYGGQRRSTSGSSQGCSFGSSCCVSAATTCGRTTRLNNTYWESPSKVSSVSSCSLTIRLPDSIPVCQVRLDFISFSIAQPNSESMCTTDTFAVAGAANKVPTICGDNDDQHMYLTTQSTESNIQLLFNFGQSGIARSWKIKVDMLPCGSNYLAPSNCLQYFTETTGSVSSFNWKDTTSLRTRQLAHQDYSICFRSELIDDVDESNSLCLTPCTIFQSDTAFSVSGSTEGSQRSVADCNNDYVLIEGGYDPSEKNDLGLPKTLQDRYCGSQFSMKQSATTSGRICTNYKTFKITYRTNGDETSTANVDRTGMGNQGFCLSFKQTLDA